MFYTLSTNLKLFRGYVYLLFSVEKEQDFFIVAYFQLLLFWINLLFIILPFFVYLVVKSF